MNTRVLSLSVMLAGTMFAAGCHKGESPFPEEDGCISQPMPDGDEWVQTCVESTYWHDPMTIAITGSRVMSPERKTKEGSGKEYVDFPPIYGYFRVFDHGTREERDILGPIFVALRGFDTFKGEGTFLGQATADQAHEDPKSLDLFMEFEVMDRGKCPYSSDPACRGEIELSFPSNL